MYSSSHPSICRISFLRTIRTSNRAWLRCMSLLNGLSTASVSSNPFCGSKVIRHSMTTVISPHSLSGKTYWTSEWFIIIDYLDAVFSDFSLTFPMEPLPMYRSMPGPSQCCKHTVTMLISHRGTKTIMLCCEIESNNTLKHRFIRRAQATSSCRQSGPCASTCCCTS